ncbi:MAG: universal stress protein [Gammaproteobacteria bacterium]|nr:universal stress protein [Gammaproteobacteria bacterium]
MANLAVLYSGSPEEHPAVKFTAALAAALRVPAESRFMAGVRAIIGPEQWREYQTILGLEGFANARPIFDEQFQSLLTERLRNAEAELAKLPEAGSFARGPAIELLHMPETTFATFGFTYDLLLASFDADPVIPELLIGQTLIRGGGPIALIKEAPHFEKFSDSTVIVAWKPLAAAKRALQNALPLLRVAKRVCVVTANEYGESAMNPDASAVALYLSACHQIRATPHMLPSADSPEAQLTEFYREVGADLMVMGGYSHSRLKELLFGGFTQYFTEKKVCNLYQAH